MRVVLTQSVCGCTAQAFVCEVPPECGTTKPFCWVGRQCSARCAGRMNRYRFRTSDEVAGHVYSSDDARRLDRAARRLVVFCPGLPYVPDREFVTTRFVEAGFDVIQIQYVGTYDSAGTFSPQSAVTSVHRV